MATTVEVVVLPPQLGFFGLAAVAELAIASRPACGEVGLGISSGSSYVSCLARAAPVGRAGISGS